MRFLSPCPVDVILPEVKEKVRRNPSVVLHAPPGAGKTTRIPLALLDILPPEAGRIIMLEPRRIAAVSAARWMAQTLGEEPGETVGYSIRFDSRLSKATRIEVVTEGILTRRIQNDPALEGIAVVIFDEFHERNLHSDLALALCLDLQSGLREDLRILVMSATLDCEPICSLLGGAALIRCAGKAFPVEERYLPPERRDGPVQTSVTHAVCTALRETEGDILAFLPGAGEIRACAEGLRKTLGGRAEDIEACPLYGELSFEEQQRALSPSRKRKVILATNIAETSLTIEGVRVVIDSGLTRRLRHDPSTGMNRLITASVSKAEAEQRKGRAGRLAPGVCYRLYTPHEYRSMVPFAQPEICVSDLSPLSLELAAWGVRDPRALSWIDLPPAAAWEKARRLLADLGALDDSGSLTPAGRAMVGMPLHPRLARMLLKGRELGCPDLAADLAAVLSERDVMRGGSERRIGRSIEPDISERLDLLRSWRTKEGAAENGDALSLKRTAKAARQLLRLIGADRGVTEKDIHSDTISRLLLCAFPDRIAKRREDGAGRFVMAQGRGMRLSTASRMGQSPFIIAVNVDAGEGTEGFVHMASALTADLIRSECDRLIRTCREVRWDKRDERIVGAIEERIGSVVLSSRPFNPSDEEAAPVLCDLIRSVPGTVIFSAEARQFQGRVSLMRNLFPEERWPDLSDEHLPACPEEWLLPWLSGVRSSNALSRVDIREALKARLSHDQMRALEMRAPAAVTVPSGRKVQIDYTSGDVPILAVKLQELFGLADSPEIAGGRVKLLLHLLSPARRPVQITRDLRAFWETGYHQVKKELKGRYPKHPWPDDPWSAQPTQRTKTARAEK